MIKTLQKLFFIWLYKTPNKRPSADYISVDKNNKRIVKANLKKVYFKDICSISSNTEKNYCLIHTVNQKQYYYNGSIDTLVKMSNIQFIRVNRGQAVNYNYVTERLNNAYVFIGENFYRIGDSYKKSVVDFFVKMQNQQL